MVAYLQSPIGAIKITGSESGISSIGFVKSETRFLVNQSTNEADVSEKTDFSDHILAEAVRQLTEYFAGARKEFSLKLDLRGSDFQTQVWRYLLTIQFGKTNSYLDVALALGDRKSIRAVGRANGQNPIAIVVPCHRVIGSDGSLTGYGGELWRKEWLLNFEGSRLQAPLFDPRQVMVDAKR
ncbi:MAG: methylated-DNA--[protein]-cysteine S-methyltransferase [Chloroflexi bacterium]|nr:methylated-DNA--[protein]-cysteine S-methyltransferase [Chloroflexota bacterium]